MEFHHIGCVVQSIEQAARLYGKLFPEATVSLPEIVNEQQVRVCFVQFPGGVRMELIESLAPDSPVAGLLERGGGLYHLSFATECYDRDTGNLLSNGFIKINEFNSEAFNGNRCMFLIGPDRVLFEICEIGA